MIFLPTSENIQKAASLLMQGDIVSFPTETVYGLGGLAGSDTATLRIFDIKSRPVYNPLIVHVDSMAQAQRIGIFDFVALKMAEVFWPGPLTIVVSKNPTARLSVYATGGLETVAIRWSRHPVLQRILSLTGEPIVAPSANPSGLLTATTAHHVHKAFPELFILDGGQANAGIESTIVRVMGEGVQILRSGAITVEDIQQKMGPVIVTVSQNSVGSENIICPGQSLAHYAPTLPLRLDATDFEEGEALLGFGAMCLPVTLNLSPRGNLEEAAHNLFSYLHILDDPERYRGIAVASVPKIGLGVALNDRLCRAAQPRLL